MNITELYQKVPVAKHPNIHLVMDGSLVVYDDGVNVYEAWMDDQGELAPRNAQTRNALNALSAL